MKLLHFGLLGSFLLIPLTVHCTADLEQGNPCYAIGSAYCNYEQRCAPGTAAATQCQTDLGNSDNFKNCDISSDTARSCASDIDSLPCSASAPTPASCASITIGGGGGGGGTHCNGQTVDLTSDPNNCGYCGHVCSAFVGGSVTCINSQCTSSSSGGSCNGGVGTLCNGSCVDTTSDSSNCGSCGNQCPAASFAGVSSMSCTSSQCNYPGAFCNAGTVTAPSCVCPAHSQCSSNGCICDSGYHSTTCNGTSCSGSGCGSNFKCSLGP